MREVIACYFTDWYFNRLYLYAKERANSRGTTITDCYRDIVLSYTNEVCKQEDSFRATVNKMYEYLRRSQKTVSFKQFIDDFLLTFIPPKHFKFVNEEQKDFFLNEILKEMITNFTNYSLSFEHIKQVIDERSAREGKGYVTKEWVRAFVTCQVAIRDRLWSRFASEMKGGGIKGAGEDEAVCLELEKRCRQLEDQLKTMDEALRREQLKNRVAAQNGTAPPNGYKTKKEYDALWAKMKVVLENKCALEEQIENLELENTDLRRQIKEIMDSNVSVADRSSAATSHIHGPVIGAKMDSNKQSDLISLVRSSSGAQSSNYERKNDHTNDSASDSDNDSDHSSTSSEPDRSIRLSSESINKPSFKTSDDNLIALSGSDDMNIFDDAVSMAGTHISQHVSQNKPQDKSQNKLQNEYEADISEFDDIF